MPDEVCPRCGNDLHSSSMSSFNTETICTDCKIEERGFPNYERAVAADDAQILQRNYRFQGIGLASEDRAAMAAAINARKPKKPIASNGICYNCGEPISSHINREGKCDLDPSVKDRR